MKKEKHESNSSEERQNEIKIERDSHNNNSKGTNQKEELKNTGEEIESAKAKIEMLEKEITDYKDKLLRKAAEFENYKRRTENDQLNLFKYAAESFIVKLLPTVDDFERSLTHINNAKDLESIKEGIKLVYEKLMKVLSEQGVVKIESIGKPFNVHYHEAIMQRPVENVAPHTVVDEIEKGYMYKDRVIRHAKVIVSEDLGEGHPEQSGSQNDEQTSNED